MTTISTVGDFVRAFAQEPQAANTLFAVLSQHGRDWPPAPKPKDVPRGQLGACFGNCQQIAMAQKQYVYCEGYAAGIIPVLHAWLIDEAGNVVDPTWCGSGEWSNGKRWPGNRPPLGSQYFGVAVQTRYVIRCVVRMERHHSLFETGDLKEPAADWLDPRNKQ